MAEHESSQSKLTDQVEIGEWRIKTEDVEISDYEAEIEPDLEYSCSLADEPTLPPIQVQGLNWQVKTEAPEKERDRKSPSVFPSFDCATCMEKFPNKKSLEKHITGSCSKNLGPQNKVVSSRQANDKKVQFPSGKTPHWTKMFECQLCIRKFDVKSELRLHIRNHPKAHNYPCEICRKVFRRSGHRNRHMLTHSGRCKFECDSCDKSFTRKSNRDRHKLTHAAAADSKPPAGRLAGDRNFGCAVCRKAYKTNAQRNKHMVVHSGKRAFKCQTCDNTFAKKDHLNKHMLVHSGVRSHECYVCHKAFVHSGARNRHMLIHMERRSALT